MNAEYIRQMDDEQLVNLLVWREYRDFRFIPSCDEECLYEQPGCAITCLHDRRERTVRKWLKEEVQ